MSIEPNIEQLQVGDIVSETVLHFTRDTLVRYAGASGDFNPIHYRDDVAQSVGLEGVLAHGMLTMAAVASPVVDWLGSNGFVSDYQVRFTKPVFVDAHHGADVVVTATVAVVDTEARTARVDIRATFNEQTVLAKSQIVLTFS